MSASTRHPKRKLRVAVTGANGCVGKLTIERLLGCNRVERVLALDVTPPEVEPPALLHAALDLSRANATERLGQDLADFRANALIHLAFFASPIRDAAFAHEVEAIGTGHVLAACASARVRRFVMSSTTLVYGASANNPNFLAEDRPLPAWSGSPYVADKIEAEQQVRSYRHSHPELRSVVLRFASMVGPSIDTPVTRYLRRAVAPVVFGHDPLIQCIHEEDVAEALLLAVLADRTGELNLCGRGVVPLSTALRLTGARALPLPFPFAEALLRALNAVGVTALPPPMLDYLRFLWVADGAAAERDLGFKPRYGTREALLSLAEARRRAAAA